jgi:glycosyltransferase involved in cell wall biosynthesis
MNILHVLEDFSINNGGVTTVVRALHKHLLKAGLNSYILSPNCEDESENIFPIKSLKAWRLSWNFNKKLKEICTTYNIHIIHIHGVWMHPQFQSAKYAVKNKIPFVVSAHGMYEPWLWTKGTLKKKLYVKFVVQQFFEKSTSFHAITRNEVHSLKEVFGANINTFEIPNLIEQEKLKFTSDVNHYGKYFLYLGRLHEKKGIDLLIKAFSKLKKPEIKLVIAGEFNTYKNELDELINKEKISEKVIFTNLVKGKTKFNLYKNALAFVAPSHSEVIGMVNIEAAISNTPVITTYDTGIDKRWNEEGGILISLNEQNLYEALKKAAEWSDNERNSRGETLKKFVIEHYSWEKRGKDWVDNYTSILMR